MKERLKEIDILRAAAFMFVVAQHTIGGFSNTKGISFTEFGILKFLYVVAQTAVPIFLFISGMSLFYVYSNKFDWKKYYIKRIKFVLVPYIIWSAINIYKMGDIEKFQSFILQVVSGNGAYHFWYMGMILRLYLIFPIILIVAKKIHSSNITFRVVTFIALIVGYYYVSKYCNVIGDKVIAILFKNPNDLERRAVNISALFWYIYFVLGIYFALNYNYIKNLILRSKAVICITYMPLLTYAYLYEIKYKNLQFIRSLWIAYIIVSIVFFYMIANILINRVKLYKFMKYISDYSFSAYMLHVIMINYSITWIVVLLKVKDTLLLGILAWLTTALVSTVIINLIALIPYSQFITGVKGIKTKELISTLCESIKNTNFDSKESKSA